MQTFLPYSNFRKCAECLDRQRLGKQRVEALQILNTLSGTSKGWVNHPAVKMWRGHEYLLKLYLASMILEWMDRGYLNTISPPLTGPAKTSGPEWLGDERLHSSHRAALLYKDFDYYSQFGWSEKPDLNYYWPV